MPSKTKPLPPKELAAYEAGRDLGAELLQSIREMKAGKLSVVHSPAAEARIKPSTPATPPLSPPAPPDPACPPR